MDEIKQSKQELLDCIINLMAVVDTPLGRKQIKGDFADDARKIARKILEDNNKSLLPDYK
jgi:hypothetical protein